MEPGILRVHAHDPCRENGIKAYNRHAAQDYPGGNLLTVFIPFSVFFLKESFKTDYIWACLCILGAVFFIFREKITG